MRRRNQGIYLLFWIGAGMLLATVFANRVFASGLVDYRILYHYLQKGWQKMIEKDWKCIMRILLIRSVQTLAVEFICRNRLHRLLVPLMLVWIGFSVGFSMVLMTWYQGMFGLIVFLVSNFPHQLFYGTAWGILIFKCLSGYEARKRRFWGAVAAFLLFGVLTEVHVNSMLLSWLPVL